MKNKDKILDIIHKYHCGVTAKQIFEKLSWDLDKTTVYRNVEKLLTQSEIIEDFDKNWEKRYSLHKHHHHHFLCNECWKKINIWCFFEKELKKLEREQNITITNHSFLLNGLCDECKK
jgi:Fe2+ or Zn2+ uptake regulation protein